jgi:hypothetical protein
MQNPLVAAMGGGSVNLSKRWALRLVWTAATMLAFSMLHVLGMAFVRATLVAEEARLHQFKIVRVHRTRLVYAG